MAENTSIEQKVILNRALQLLSLREHSFQELIVKLNTKFAQQPQIVIAVVEQLRQKNLQSDQRYCELLIRSKVRQGNGRKKISYLLQQQGISEQVFQAALDFIDWQQKALELLVKRDIKIFDIKQQQKQFRYLQNKGFQFDEIQQAWHNLKLLK